MATAIIPKNPIANWEKVRDEWLNQLNDLLTHAQTWAEECGWATRRIDKRMDDAQIGAFLAPALLMQEGTTRVILEPIARFALGADGVVDLYRMPAYDDIVRLILGNGEWRIHDWPPSECANGDDLETDRSMPWSKENLAKVLHEIRNHGA